MINSDKKLGEKIRDLRLRRGITQKELAGERITRNMLSLIENGSASPSVSTLLYLAEQLETPVGYFFSSSAEDEGRFLKMSVIGSLKTAFRMKNYRECETIGAAVPPAAVDDELAYLLAVSYLNTSEEAANQLNMKTASADLDHAEAYAKLSLYCGDQFAKALSYHRTLFRSACSETVPDLLCDVGYGGEFVPGSMIQYYLSLRQIKAGETSPFVFLRGSYAERHISALTLLQEDHVTEALKKLRELSLDARLPFYMQYRVLSDLEDAANLSGDLRLAYSSSRRKLELIEIFRL